MRCTMVSLITCGLSLLGNFWPAALAADKIVLPLNGVWTQTSKGVTVSLSVPASQPFFGGTSVWTRTFSLNLEQAPTVAYVEFDGIANTAVVKLNGRQVGALTAFTHTRLDVSAALNWTGDNTLEVDIDDRLSSDTVPGGPIESFVPALGAVAYALPVAWSPDGGIFRDVSLVYSSHAVITDASVTEEFAVDFSNVALNLTLKISGADASSLYGAAGVILAGTSKGQCLALRVQANTLSCTVNVSTPQLWSPSAPIRYDFTAMLFDASGVVDVVQDQVGLRKIETAGNRLLLNGKPVFLRGITRHDIYGSHGFVADEPTMRQDFLRMQQLGVNYVRCIHYPPDPRVARIADEMGMLISEEIPVYASVNSPAVVSTAANMVTAMIARDYNRASVILWIAGNGPVLDANYLGTVGTTIALHDSSRPYTFVIDDPQSSTAAKIVEDAAYLRNAGMKVYAQNGYWYSSLIDTLVPAMPSDMPVVITEWAGSEGSDLGPIGAVGTKAFPNFTFPDTGVFPSPFQAYTLYYSLFPWISHTDCSNSLGKACVSGLTFFNWQDVQWPGMPYFYPGHNPVAYSGLVYEDRTPKVWPRIMFQYAYQLLPR
jgi:beta-glucuronidase